MSSAVATACARNAPPSSGPQTADARYRASRVASVSTIDDRSRGLANSASSTSQVSLWYPDSRRKCPVLSGTLVQGLQLVVMLRLSADDRADFSVPIVVENAGGNPAKAGSHVHARELSAN